ncbi:glycosyltransferase [Desulfobacter postgatei]|jgi:glycosyltransferase involved in cell wall biosynthesis|uniref:glycosyltransferase n=1 Tax=Desulfobacter postgatei TaxID=2293 RepID=UPI002A35BA55|nr:glycosyltransferase [Desulfobacter postgatei]MDX9964229.1 glycosyltransferase [Desulfobacter postgatei]
MKKEFIKNLYWAFATRWRMFKGRQLPAWKSYASIWADTKYKKVVRPNVWDRNIVLLAGDFPPEVTGGIYRPVSFLRRVSSAGWKVSVVTDPRPEFVSEAGEYMESLIPKTVRIYRIPISAVGWHSWPLPNIDRGIMSAMAVYEAACAVMADRAPGIIVATGPPFHNFVAGMWLAKKFGWKFVLDYRDEWTENVQGFVKKDKINSEWEKKCLIQADRVVFTTQSQATHQAKVFQQLNIEKCKVVYNGWEPEEFVKDAGETPKYESNQEKELTIVFFGNLGGWYKIGDFLEKISQVFDAAPDLRQRIRLQFVGQMSAKAMSEIERFSYPEVISISDLVPKKKACRMMQCAKSLLLLNPPSMGRYISGKTYEYIASGRPILLFGEGGEMADIVKELDAGIIVPSDDAIALEKALRRIGSHVSSKGEALASWLQSRTRETMADEMLSLLEKLRISS